MTNTFFRDKLVAIIDITRINNHTGFLLLFFPTTFGVSLAYQTILDYRYLSIFFIGSIAARSLGCIINDIFDRDIDHLVQRTKNRPLVTKKLNLYEAIFIALILLSACVTIAIQLSVTSIVLSIVGLLLMAIYPISKRITYFPQIFLGLTFNLGVLIGYSALTDNMSPKSITLYLGCVCWTVAYDAIYAFMDIEDDKKHGIKSIAVFLEDRSFKLFILVMYFIFFASLTWAFNDTKTLFFIIAVLASILYSIWIVVSLDITDASNCWHRFRANSVIGLMIFFGILLEKI